MFKQSVLMALNLAKGRSREIGSEYGEVSALTKDGEQF